jgi:hypothetical protein
VSSAFAPHVAFADYVNRQIRHYPSDIDRL